MYKYKRVDITTLKGLKEAEQLKSKGWKIIAIGFCSAQFEYVIKGATQ